MRLGGLYLHRSGKLGLLLSEAMRAGKLAGLYVVSLKHESWETSRLVCCIIEA